MKDFDSRFLLPWKGFKIGDMFIVEREQNPLTKFGLSKDYLVISGLDNKETLKTVDAEMLFYAQKNELWEYIDGEGDC